MGKRLLMFLVGLFLSVGTLLAQTQISGKVTSAEDGLPVIGASVKVPGTTEGAVTDIDGEFTINVKQDASLEVSYIGMQTATVKAKNGMTVVLQPDETSMDEVIVTGYGNIRKSSFTGAAATINTDKLDDVPAVSLEDKLAGGVPGVTIGTSSGAPGAVSNIRIRGMGSINAGNEPLIVIDGVPATSGNLALFEYADAGTNILSTINSNDIESMTVIKDAAAASLYGSRAANGVIVITTKSGQQGKTSVNFRSDWGFSEMAINYRPQLSGDERREVLTLGLKNYAIYQGGMDEASATQWAAGNIDNFAPVPENGYTNWEKTLLRTGIHQNYEMSLNGGSQNTKFYASLAYTNQDGILYNSGLERFTGTFNLSHHYKRFDFNINSKFSKMNQEIAGEGTGYTAAIANIYFFQNPSESPYNADGTLASGCGLFGVNPVYELEHANDKSRVYRALNSVSVKYNIWDALNIMERLSYDYMNSTEDVLWDKNSLNGSPSGVMQRSIVDVRQFNAQTQLTYIKSFGLHNLDALLGWEIEDYRYGYNYLNGHDYPTDLYEFGNAGTTSAESYKSSYRLTSFLGRVNYNYDNKYYLGASFRRDGSSRLSRENRWGDFWSVSGAWRFTEEKFMTPAKSWLTDGKVRVSYGVNGTQPSDYYAYMTLYKLGLKYNGQGGMGIIGVGNSDLKWEKNYAFNAGIDLQFFNRLNVTFDYYTRTTKDLIYDMPVSAVPGFYDGTTYSPTAPQNIGSLRNSGYELTIQSVNFRKKNFEWTTMFNIGHNSNKVVKLNGTDNEVISGLLIHRVGEPYYSYWGYEYAGVDPETGKELYYINDGTENARNTTTEVSKANKTIIGKHQATVEGGLTNNLRWKDFDLGFTLTYSLGGDAYDYATWQQTNGGQYCYYGSLPAYYKIEDMWTGPGDTSAKLPKFEYGSSRVSSSRWIMPTDYLRVKNLTFGYTLPKVATRRAGIERARIYFSASNLLTWKSKDLYVDPEMPVNGLCTFETPALRTYTFGIDLAF